MDNEALRIAMVSRLASNTLIRNEKIEDARIFQEDSAKAIVAERATFNIDRRNVAIGGTPEIWIHDQISYMDQPWFDLITSLNEPAEMLLMAKQPKNILVFSPGMGSGLYIWLKERSLLGTKITFMNNPALDAFEQHILGRNDPHTLDDYSVIEYADLENWNDEKFDFIHTYAWDIVSDPEV